MAKKLNAGFFDRIISIKEPVLMRNDYGEEETIYKTICSCFAMLEKQNGKEEEETNQIVATSKTVFVIRYTTVKESYVIYYNNLLYDIVSIEEQGRRSFLRITATKKDNQ